MRPLGLLLLPLFFLTLLFPEVVPMAHSEEPKAYEWMIVNAAVYDGETPRPRRLDVAIHSERIGAVGKLDASDAERVIDGSGLILMPGLIDPHTHSDFNSWVYPELANKLYQGVTSEISGNCGMSAAPSEGEHRKQIHAIWAREGVHLPKGELPWRSVREYRAFMQKKGLLTHQGVLAGHGNLRAAVMGFENRPAEAHEIQKMRELLKQAMDQGALGVSFGLVYLPGLYAREDEIREVCRAAAEKDGVCAFHMRSEGRGLAESVRETLRIAEAAGAKVQISHLKAAGPQNWDRIDEAFRLIEEARAKGLRVRADAYPYEASFAELGVVLPDSLYQRPDREEYFLDPLNRAAIQAELKDYYAKNPRNWEKVMVASVTAEEDRAAQGQTIAALASQRKAAPEEVLTEILARSRFEVSAFYFSQSPEVVRRVLEKDYVAAGSDSIADGIEYPHPRAFGTFPKMIQELAGLKPELLGAWIRKSTAETADFFGIKDRGRIVPGAYADLVLIDPLKIKGAADYANPARLSEGVRWVFLNGSPAVREGLYEKEKFGRFIGD